MREWRDEGSAHVPPAAALNRLHAKAILAVFLMSCLCSRKVSPLVPVEKEYVGSKNIKGQRHGKGRLTLQDGRVFTGHFKAGKALSGSIAYPNGDTFDGTISYSFLPVQGVFSWAAGPRAGCIYKGPHKEGQPHGPRGIYVFANQTIYDGPFEGGHPHGQGIVKFSLDAPGDTFDGTMVKGAIDGPGKLVYKDGAVYCGRVLGTAPEQGSLVRRQGQGTLTSVNGDVYTGGFLDDKRQGWGVFLSSRGSGSGGAMGGGSARRRSFDASGTERAAAPPLQLPAAPTATGPSPSPSSSSSRRRSFDGAPSGKYSGTAVANNASTAITSTNSSSDISSSSGSSSGGSSNAKTPQYRYEGSWHDDRRHGRGRETQPRGGYYDGGWEADVRHGAGMYLYPDGRLYSIRYNLGEVSEMKMEADGSSKVAKAEKRKESCGMM